MRLLFCTSKYDARIIVKHLCVSYRYLYVNAATVNAPLAWYVLPTVFYEFLCICIFGK